MSEIVQKPYSGMSDKETKKIDACVLAIVAEGKKTKEEAIPICIAEVKNERKKSSNNNIIDMNKKPFKFKAMLDFSKTYIQVEGIEGKFEDEKSLAKYLQENKSEEILKKVKDNSDIEKAAEDMATNMPKKYYVEGVASTDDVDLDYEKMSKSAIKSMVESANKNKVPLMYAHRTEALDDLGKFVDAYELDEGSRMFTKFELNNFDEDAMAKKLWSKLKNGDNQIGFSVGGTVNDWIYEYDKSVDKTIRTYTDINLEEVSITGRPANPHTFVGALSKSFRKAEEKAREINSLKMGDFVSWTCDTGKACGRIESILNDNNQMLATIRVYNQVDPMDDMGPDMDEEDMMYSPSEECVSMTCSDLTKIGCLDKSLKDIINYFTSIIEKDSSSESELSKASIDSNKVSEVYKAYHEVVNMTASELSAWKDNPCSQEVSLSKTAIESNLQLLSKNMEDWTMADVRSANRTISFVNRVKSLEAGEDVSKECPFSLQMIALKNWAYDPVNVIKMTAEERNALPDSAFAYVSDDGKTRKLPIHDAAHTRNALARFSHTDIPESAKAGAWKKILAAAKKFGIEVSDTNKSVTVDEIDWHDILWGYVLGDVKLLPIDNLENTVASIGGFLSADIPDTAREGVWLKLLDAATKFGYETHGLTMPSKVVDKNLVADEMAEEDAEETVQQLLNPIYDAYWALMEVIRDNPMSYLQALKDFVEVLNSMLPTEQMGAGVQMYSQADMVQMGKTKVSAKEAYSMVSKQNTLLTREKDQLSKTIEKLQESIDSYKSKPVYPEVVKYDTSKEEGNNSNGKVKGELINEVLSKVFTQKAFVREQEYTEDEAVQTLKDFRGSNRDCSPHIALIRQLFNS